MFRLMRDVSCSKPKATFTNGADKFILFLRPGVLAIICSQLWLTPMNAFYMLLLIGLSRELFLTNFALEGFFLML